MKKKTLILLILASILAIFTISLSVFFIFFNNTEELEIETNTQEETTLISNNTFKIVSTGQTNCYSEEELIPCPEQGEDFYGQNGTYIINEASYTDNGDKTVTDNVTNLMWQQDPGEKISYDEAVETIKDFDLAGYTDWRIPTIKELYSLIDFNGTDPDPLAIDESNLVPFLDNSVFNFVYGDTTNNERIIDSQYGSSNKYVYTTMNGDETLFGVNFADGRIKGYGMQLFGNDKTFFFMFVRGNDYGVNNFELETEDIVIDNSTRLSWQQADSTKAMIWKDSLSYCENLELGNHTDWRLPNVKELQYIVDYGRSPDTTDSAAIDPIFSTSTITNEMDELDYPFFWSSTTHLSASGNAGRGSYVSFGRATGYMNSVWMDVHGAGAQRSDPKIGDPANYSEGKGPQGDAIRIYNYVRCVRNESN